MLKYSLYLNIVLVSYSLLTTILLLVTIYKLDQLR